jgi:hypothetical protein
MTGGGAQLGSYLVRSVTYTAYASVADRTEVPAANARYFEGDLFSGPNASGTNYGRCSVDTADAIFTHYGKANLQDALVEIFGYMGPDN